MSPESAESQAPVALAGGTSVGAAPRVLPLVAAPRLRVRSLAWAQRPRAGRLALATILLGTFWIVAFATASENVLVPRANLSYPTWESGPLHYIFRFLPIYQHALNIGFTVVVLMMLASWGIAVAALRTLSLRTIVLSIVAVHAIVLFSPPQQLHDVFNYIGYARLGAVHHLNPYSHVIGNEMHDPVYRFSSWHNLSSPYGPLFTAMTYPLAFLPLPVAYWTLKLFTMLCSLGLVALVYRCARQLGRDPRYALVFVALNPIYIAYAMFGFHNDFFMLVPMLAAVSLLLSRRDRSAGAILMLAVAIKFTAVLLLPFLLLGVRQNRRRIDIVAGAALGAIPMAILSLALFGLKLPNLADQSTLLTPFSISNLTGLVIGADGASPAVLRVANVLVVLCVAWLLKRRGEWLSSAGWATVALIASLAWLMPWYVIWVLPFAALGRSLRLRRAAVALTVFLVLTFTPMTGKILYPLGLNPLNTKVGHASSTLQKKLANYGVTPSP